MGWGSEKLSEFNQALLAKQMWKWFQNSGLLANRVLNAKYIRSGNIWSVNCENRESFVWRSGDEIY